MSRILTPESPFFPHRPRRALTLTMIAATLLAAACRDEGITRHFDLTTLNRLYEGLETPSPTEFRLDSQPFSPTLPYLFDRARIAVLPKPAVGAPPASIPAETYAFSAVGRFGRVYHFDTQGRWWMAEGVTLPEALPESGWFAAWNDRAGVLELLIGVPWNGESALQLLRWRHGRWVQVKLIQAPKAGSPPLALYHAAESRWLIVQGNKAWTVEGAGWKTWAGGTGGPRMDQLYTLIDGPGGPIALTRSGAIWLRKEGKWKSAGNVKIENLRLAFGVPLLGRVLFIWGRGRGQDQYLWQTVQQIENGSTSMPEILPQTGIVKVNDREEGLWKGWGRARQEKDKLGQTTDKLEPDFAGAGEAAILLGLPDHDKVFRRGAIHMLELPPSMDTVRFEAAAWAPALNGIVAPSNCGMGIDTRQDPFFPQAAWAAGTTSASQATINILEHSYRFWIFRQAGLDWLKSPSEIHPGIDYASSYLTKDGRRRCLAWTLSEPGMLRYDFHEFHDKKVQWINSPRLTLKTIPQLKLGPGDEIFTVDPVVWGDPPEVVLAGWCGRMGTRKVFEKSPQGLGDEAYSQVPDRGFMARINALEPSEWKVSTLPIPFCQGVQVVVDPDHDSLYLLGGKTFDPIDYDHQQLYFGRSNNDVWNWDGENWRKISPESGIQPRMKATSQVVYDPASHQMLGLTPRALYGFQGDVWHGLWQRPKTKGDWPDDVALYVHPQTNLVLGAWFMPEPILRVWRQPGWVPANLENRRGATSAPRPWRPEIEGPGGPLPDVADDLIPSSSPNTFISIDSRQLNAMRMDAPRERDRDRLMGAHWLTFKPANAGTIPYARQPLGQEAPTSGTMPLAAADAATSPTLAATEDATTETKKGNDGKIVRKNRTGLLMRELEAQTR